MRRDDRMSVEDGDAVHRRPGDERATRQSVRDGVVVEIEARVRSFSDLDIHALVGREYIARKREEALPLRFKRLANGDCRLARTAPVARDAMTPGVGLRIEIFDV